MNLRGTQLSPQWAPCLLTRCWTVCFLPTGNKAGVIPAPRGPRGPRHSRSRATSADEGVRFQQPLTCRDCAAAPAGRWGLPSSSSPTVGGLASRPGLGHHVMCIFLGLAPPTGASGQTPVTALGPGCSSQQLPAAQPQLGCLLPASVPEGGAWVPLRASGQEPGGTLRKEPGPSRGHPTHPRGGNVNLLRGARDPHHLLGLLPYMEIQPYTQ